MLGVDLCFEKIKTVCRSLILYLNAAVVNTTQEYSINFTRNPQYRITIKMELSRKNNLFS